MTTSNAGYSPLASIAAAIGEPADSFADLFSLTRPNGDIVIDLDAFGGLFAGEADPVEDDDFDDDDDEDLDDDEDDDFDEDLDEADDLDEDDEDDEDDLDDLDALDAPSRRSYAAAVCVAYRRIPAAAAP